jgi:hypothetical protein
MTLTPDLVPKRAKILKALTMSPLSDLEIDEAILSVTGASWRKVAFVIIKVADAIGSDLSEGDAGYNLVAERIEILVRGGRLLAQGDIKKWRHSEVRKPN